MNYLQFYFIFVGIFILSIATLAVSVVSYMEVKDLRSDLFNSECKVIE